MPQLSNLTKPALWKRAKALGTTLSYRTATKAAIQQFITQHTASKTITGFLRKKTQKNLVEFINNPADKKSIITSANELYKVIDKLTPKSGYYLTIGSIEHHDGYNTRNFRIIQDFGEFKNFLEEAISGISLNEEETYGSDEKILYDIIEYGYDLFLRWNSESSNTKKHSGAFFKYYNLTKFDLRRYQIFTKSDNTVIEDQLPCFLYALKLSGLVSQSDIENLALSFTMKLIANSDLSKIGKQLDITIRVHRDYKHIVDFNKGCEKVLNLGLIDNHYFLNEETRITKYAIENYEEVKDHKKFPSVRNPKLKHKMTTLSSYNVIRLLFEQCNQFFEAITLSNLNNTDLTEKLIEYSDLREPKQNCKCPGLCKNNCIENEFRHYGEVSKSKPFNHDFNGFNPNKNYAIWFIDTETFIPQTSELGNHHIANCICAHKYNMAGEFIESVSYYGLDCVGKFMYEQLTENAIIYAHNMAFDFRQFIDASYKCMNTHMKMEYDSEEKMYVPKKFDNGDIYLTEFQTPIETGTKLKQIQCKINRTTITSKGIKTHIRKSLVFKDSYAFIASALREFPKMFALDCGDKDVFPYTLITEYNQESMIPIEQCNEHLKPEQIETFKNNAIKIGAYTNEEVDIKKYTIHYCMQDVRILAEGFMKFRSQIKEVCHLDIINLTSLPQLADQYFKSLGVYTDCYSINGIAQDFIRRCVVGGRVMSNSNKKWNLEKPIQDFDAVSLYPSAMYRLIGGFLKGLPKVLNKEQCISYSPDQYDGSYVEIKVLSHSINRQFPLQSVLVNGIRDFTNDIDGKHFYVDNIALEDFIKFHGIEYEVIRGYYYDSGFNPTIKESIAEIFNKRNELKSQGNALQLIYKLLMNSSYGKLLQKPISKSKVFIDYEEGDNYLARNNKFITEFNYIGDRVIAVTQKKSVVQSFACPHLGTQVLSMSKRIMNEVMCLAEDLGLFIAYQDTDSMHILEEQIPILENEYRAIYKRELIGKAMGQFHSDFEVSERGAKNVRAVKSIIVGKKVYVDKLSYEVDGITKFSYHVRVKGIPSQAIIDFDADLMKTYTRLYNGEALSFDLKKYIPLQLDRDYRARANTRCVSRKLQFTC